MNYTTINSVCTSKSKRPLEGESISIKKVSICSIEIYNLRPNGIKFKINLFEDPENNVVTFSKRKKIIKIGYNM